MVTPVKHSVLIVNSVLNMKVVVGNFNQEKALVGAFSVIVTTDGSFADLLMSLRAAAPVMRQ